MARKNDILSIYTKEVEQIKADGLFKGEAPFVSPQGAKVVMEDGRELLNMCANNYLGLGDNQRLIDAAKRTYDEKGYGVASVRFICGTQDIHKKLEKKISGFLGTDDTILYSSCFDANGGLFETILTAEDAVISDELNHASIIDGVRLCKAKRYRYKNNNMEDLEAQLQAARQRNFRILWRRRKSGYHYRNTRKSTRWGFRWIYIRKKRDHRSASSEKSSVPVLQLSCTGNRRSKY